jgi:hypothetical protein
MLSPQGAVSALRRPLLKSEKWRTRPFDLPLAKVDYMCHVGAGTRPVGCEAKTVFPSLPGEINGKRAGSV